MNSTGIIEHTRRVEHELASACALKRIDLDPDIERRTGTFRGAPVTIESAAYRGSKLRLARFAVVYGKSLEIGNVMCVPDPAYVVPILGADLVAVRPDSVMIAADLSPVSQSPDDHEEQFQMVFQALSTRPPVPSGGELPEWAQELFSPHSLYTRAGLSELDNAFKTFHIYPEVFRNMLDSSRPDPQRLEEISSAQSRYMDVHRNDDKGLRLLGAMFDMDWAKRYLETFLFPLDLHY
jgi:phycocyanobilin:ferredoxin oxidoreductase